MSRFPVANYGVSLTQLAHIPDAVMRAARKAATTGRSYEVTFSTKRLLGFKVKPKGDNWAVVSETKPGNGIAKGSVLMSVNGQSVLEKGLYAVYEQEMKEWQPPITFVFRQPPTGGGMLGVMLPTAGLGGGHHADLKGAGAMQHSAHGKWAQQFVWLKNGCLVSGGWEGGRPRSRVEMMRVPYHPHALTKHPHAC